MRVGNKKIIINRKLICLPDVISNERSCQEESLCQRVERTSSVLARSDEIQ